MTWEDDCLFAPLRSSAFLYKIEKSKLRGAYDIVHFNANGNTLYSEKEGFPATLNVSDVFGSKDLLYLFLYMKESNLNHSYLPVSFTQYEKTMLFKSGYDMKISLAKGADLTDENALTEIHDALLQYCRELVALANTKIHLPKNGNRLPKEGGKGLLMFMVKIRNHLPKSPRCHRNFCNYVIHHCDPESLPPLADPVSEISGKFETLSVQQGTTKNFTFTFPNGGTTWKDIKEKLQLNLEVEKPFKRRRKSGERTIKVNITGTDLSVVEQIITTNFPTVVVSSNKAHKPR